MRETSDYLTVQTDRESHNFEIRRRLIIVFLFFRKVKVTQKMRLIKMKVIRSQRNRLFSLIMTLIDQINKLSRDGFLLLLSLVMNKVLMKLGMIF